MPLLKIQFSWIWPYGQGGLRSTCFLICGSQSPLIFVITFPNTHCSHRSLEILETNLPFWQLSNPCLHERCTKWMKSSFRTQPRQLLATETQPSAGHHLGPFITDMLACAFLQLLMWVQNKMTWQRHKITILYIQGLKWPACQYTTVCSHLQCIYLNKMLRK